MNTYTNRKHEEGGKTGNYNGLGKPQESKPRPLQYETGIDPGWDTNPLQSMHTHIHILIHTSFSSNDAW